MAILKNFVISFFSVCCFASMGANSQMPLTMFSVQFYRLLIDQRINVTRISRDGSFFVISGNSKNRDAVYYLSQDILKAQLMRRFKLVDSALKYHQNSFEIYIKSDIISSQSNKFNVSIDRPKIQATIETGTLLSGSCYPNGEKVIVSGDLEGTAICRKGRWSVAVRKIQVGGIQSVFVSIGKIGKKKKKDLRSFKREKPYLR